MLSDPPLIDRLLWREGIQPDTLISNDPGLIARTFGTLYLIGGGLGFGLLLIGERTENPGIGVALSGSALMLGIVCFVVYRRLPIAFFASMVTLGSVMIAAAAAAAPEGAEGVYGFFYVWVVFMSFLFFRPAVATAQTAFAAVAYGAVLIATDAPFTGDLLITAAATLVATGAIMGLLVSRMEHLAAGFVTEAHTDPVTAIANRRDFDERFELEVGRARLSRNPISLLICDLDRFKPVNDAMGHEEG